jgi:integrase
LEKNKKISTGSRLQSNPKQPIVRGRVRITETHPIYDGEVIIFRTLPSGDVWQFRHYIPEEQRYVRKSLKTRDKTIAIDKAKKLFIENKAKIQSGEKLFSLTSTELVEKFLEYLNERVAGEQISIGRYRTVKSHLKNYLDFIVKNQKIQNFAGREFRKYRTFRQQHHPDVTMTTVYNELTSIITMYKFAVDEGFINPNYKIDYGEIKNKNDAKRDGYTIEEYTKLITISKNFYKKAENKEDEYYKKIIHLFIRAMANYGFRSGELLSLKWTDITFLKGRQIEIIVREENTKVRKQRFLKENRPSKVEIFEQLKELSGDKRFVFSSFDKNQIVKKSKFYSYSVLLRNVVKEKYPNFDETKTLYSLRHFFITIHLINGSLSPYDLARYCGTSLQQIQKTYDGMVDLDISKKMMNSSEFKFLNGELITGKFGVE